MAKYKALVKWEMIGYIEVEAEDKQNAYDELTYNDYDYISKAINTDYVEESINIMDIREIKNN